jgi:hypothetical protein
MDPMGPVTTALILAGIPQIADDLLATPKSAALGHKRT